MIDISLGDLGIGIGRDDVSQKELVNELQVRPGGFEIGLFFFGIGGFLPGVFVRRRGQAPENVDRYHPNHFLLTIFGDFSRTGLYEFHQLHEGLALDLFLPGRFQRIGEIELEATNLKFSDEQALAFGDRYVSEQRQGIHGSCGRWA